MSTLEDKNKELKEKNYNQNVIDEILALIRHGIIRVETTDTLENYNQLNGETIIRYANYKLYVNKDEPIYALVSEHVNEDKKHYIYKLDYSNPTVVKEIISETSIPEKTRTTKVISALNFLAWTMIVLGVIVGLAAIEQGFLGFFLSVVSGVISAIFLFALAQILVHLQNIDDKTK